MGTGYILTCDRAVAPTARAQFLGIDPNILALAGESRHRSGFPMEDHQGCDPGKARSLIPRACRIPYGRSTNRAECAVARMRALPSGLTLFAGSGAGVCAGTGVRGLRVAVALDTPARTAAARAGRPPW